MGAEGRNDASLLLGSCTFLSLCPWIRSCSHHRCYLPRQDQYVGRITPYCWIDLIPRLDVLCRSFGGYANCLLRRLQASQVRTRRLQPCPEDLPLLIQERRKESSGFHVRSSNDCYIVLFR